MSGKYGKYGQLRRTMANNKVSETPRCLAINGLDAILSTHYKYFQTWLNMQCDISLVSQKISCDRNSIFRKRKHFSFSKRYILCKWLTIEKPGPVRLKTDNVHVFGTTPRDPFVTHFTKKRIACSDIFGDSLYVFHPCILILPLNVPIRWSMPLRKS